MNKTKNSGETTLSATGTSWALWTSYDCDERRLAHYDCDEKMRGNYLPQLKRMKWERSLKAPPTEYICKAMIGDTLRGTSRYPTVNWVIRRHPWPSEKGVPNDPECTDDSSWADRAYQTRQVVMDDCSRLIPERGLLVYSQTRQASVVHCATRAGKARQTNLGRMGRQSITDQADKCSTWGLHGQVRQGRPSGQEKHAGLIGQVNLAEISWNESRANRWSMLGESNKWNRPRWSKRSPRPGWMIKS